MIHGGITGNHGKAVPVVVAVCNLCVGGHAVICYQAMRRVLDQIPNSRRIDTAEKIVVSYDSLPFMWLVQVLFILLRNIMHFDKILYIFLVAGGR